MKNSNFAQAGARFFKNRRFQKKHDFGLVLGGFWEAKILDFRTFFDVFSISFFKRGSEGEKIDQKCEKTKLFRFLASGLRCTGRAWGGIIGRGNTRFSLDTCYKAFDVGVWCLMWQLMIRI